jgi:hypothetical protein
METTTVLAIIEMIDNRLRNFRRGPLDGMPDDFTIGEVSSLTELRDHLQEYIEQQVSAIENSTGE